jgi:hypothetical protein
LGVIKEFKIPCVGGGLCGHDHATYIARVKTEINDPVGNGNKSLATDHTITVMDEVRTLGIIDGLNSR